MISAIIFALVGMAACQMPTSAPDDCCFLTGKWRNQHGSFMVLNHTADGVLTGEYMTAVESSHGASKGGQSIHGRVGKGRPTTFGFTVSFKDGKSTSSWSGQYHLCNNKETLLATWILTSVTETCEQGWMASRIGQDEFVRINQTESVPENQFYKNHLLRKRFRKVQKLKQKVLNMWRKQGKVLGKRGRLTQKQLGKKLAQQRKQKKHLGDGGKKRFLRRQRIQGKFNIAE